MVPHHSHLQNLLFFITTVVSLLLFNKIDKPYLYALDSNGNPYSPAWYTVNLRSRYKISEGLVIVASIENITNKLYRPYSSGISAPGINFIFAINYNL